MAIKYAILGAGIGGLSAAAELKKNGEEDFIIFEKCIGLPKNLNNGVHHLHSSDLKLPFRFDLQETKLTEEVWDPRNDSFKSRANLPEMIEYSLKVMNLRHPSSIMDAGNRTQPTYLPIGNDINTLLSSLYNYIGAKHFSFSSKVEEIFPDNFCLKVDGFHQYYDKLITTVPMNRFFSIADLGCPLPVEFIHRPVFITNYPTERIAANWLIMLYVSDRRFPVYRITILNGTISMESLAPLTEEEEQIVHYHLSRYFSYALSSGSPYCWETGRIWGLNKITRSAIVRELVSKRIYPLGRFGLWNGKLEMHTTIRQAQLIVNQLNFGPSEDFIERLSE